MGCLEQFRSLTYSLNLGSPNSLRSMASRHKKVMQKNDRSIILVDAILAFWSTHLLVVAMELCVPIAAWLPANSLDMLTDVQRGRILSY